jgi:hypothetical protein
VQRAKGQKSKGLYSPRQHTYYTKTNIVVDVIARIVVAIGRTASIGIVVPRTASKYSVFHIFGEPSTTIIRCTIIATMIIILTPFPDITVHIVKSEGIGDPKTTNYGCFFASIVRYFLSDGFSKMIGSIRSCSTSIFPFCLAE